VGNAVKFTETGSVTIRIDRKPEGAPINGCMLHCGVCDTGIGIEPDKQERIVNPFEHAVAVRSLGLGSVGAGAVLARQK
jgi:two-component system sensor histidine kinase/response regulator